MKNKYLEVNPYKIEDEVLQLHSQRQANDPLWLEMHRSNKIFRQKRHQIKTRLNEVFNVDHILKLKKEKYQIKCFNDMNIFYVRSNSVKNQVVI